MEEVRIRLGALEGAGSGAGKTRPVMEFHIDKDVRRECALEGPLFALSGNVVLADLRKARELTARLNLRRKPGKAAVRSGELYAMGLIDEIFHYVIALYRRLVRPDVFDLCLRRLRERLGGETTDRLLAAFSAQFPPRPVYSGEMDVGEYLASSDSGESCRNISLEETMLLSLANLNPAFAPFRFLFDDSGLAKDTAYPAAIEEIKAHFKEMPAFGPDGLNL
ncbi:MAG: alpha-amylase, partial [Treponema sp.]|nr:alpha-amylase [Treponema sp.]